MYTKYPVWPGPTYVVEVVAYAVDESHALANAAFGDVVLQVVLSGRQTVRSIWFAEPVSQPALPVLLKPTANCPD
jgi:hypothetical protein